MTIPMDKKTSTSRRLSIMAGDGSTGQPVDRVGYGARVLPIEL